MTTRRQMVRHVFAGGWATDYGPDAPVSVNNAGQLEIPFLVNAENIVYELDGGPRKMPGTSQLSSELASGGVIKGLVDYWRQGTSASPTQKRVVHVGTVVMKDDADGSFANIFTGLESGAIPSYTQFDDLLILSSSSTTDAPKSWDQSTAQNLAGSPPNFAFSVAHKGRLWAAGIAANPSRVYYSSYLNPESWSGTGSGYISVDPDDGDMVTGLASHKGELWIFKGPYRGSIHRIAGSSPTSVDPFRHVPFVKGIGAVWHNTIFSYRDDLAFLWSDGTVNSLSATAAFGDFRSGALSRPIHKWIDEHVVFNRLKHASAAVNGSTGQAIISLAVDGATNNSAVLMMDYRFDPPRWALWPSFNETLGAGCVATVVDSAASNRRIFMAGGNDGYVRKLQQSTRSIDGTTTIAYKVTTPFLDYGSAIQRKNAGEVGLGIAPKNDGNITLGWKRDDNAQQTMTISQGGSDVLGTAANDQFTLDTSTLGGNHWSNRWDTESMVGGFRAIQYEMTNNVNNEDVEIHALNVALEGAAWSTE